MLGTITLTVGQPDGVSVAQKEDNSETMETIADEQPAQVNGEKVEKEAPEANDVTHVEEKATDEKPDETGEVGFKKIFRFGGFKFTLKKDKSEEKDPVKLLTVKDKDGEAVDGSDETPAELENGIVEEKVSPAAETEVAAKDTDHDGETANGVADAAETADEAVKDEVSEKEAESSPPPQETALSPFRKLFSTGLFSNLRKKSSIKRTKEEEEKEAAGQGEAAKTEDGGDKPEAEPDSKEDATVCQEKEKTQEETPASAQEPKPEPASDSEATSDSPASDETKPEEEEKSPVEVTSDSELVSSQEKAKSQGSPLKKLFNGTGLKKRSSKSKKGKKDTEAKLTESGEQSTELQSSTESAEAAKAESGASSSPEKSGERPAEAEGAQAEDAEGEVVTDGEKKKEGVVVWSSFKKLVTPKKRVKRPSESDDEVTGEKAAKSATLSSSESAPLADGGVEEEETKEAKEEKPCEGENAQEKLLSSTEEPKKKMDTSVSWEALMCMGGPKKRTRKTSDSDDEETKIEEESAPAAEDGKREEKNEEGAEDPQNAEVDGEASPAPETSAAPERESAWDTLKRMVMPKNKAKSEEKAEESAADQVQAESELPKDESSFSLRKLFPGLRKKKVEKQASTESEEDSDTPAVVPLSEYDTQQEVVREEPAATEETATLAEVASEERTPSWIAATVDQGDEQHDQLSDITEEAENVATPKSVDTDNVEDESEEVAPPKPPGRRLSIAEIAQAPSAETTSNETQGPKTEEARESLAPVEAQMGEIPAVTTPICQDPPVVSAAEEFEAPLEQAVSKTNHLFESHAREEAVAICTGLGTKEIAKVALEKPASPITECLSVVTHALTTTELLVQDDACELGKAVATQDALLNAQVQQERSAEIDQVGISEELIADVQTAAATREPEPPSAEVGSTLQAVEDAVTPAADFNNGDVEKDQRQALACETAAPSQEACIIKECTVLVSPPSSEPEDAANEEDSQKIEAQSSVIAQSVIQDAVDKVSVGAKSPESATPIKAVQAEMTTEKKTYFAASEYETLPIEVAEILQPSVLGEGKPEVGLKNAVEVDASEELLVEEQAVEMGGATQTNSKLQAVEEEMEEEKKIRVPVQVVLQTAQVMEGESVEEEALEEIASNGLTDGDRSEEERTPSKCAEVMAQVMEVIEEAVKEIQPASSTEVTPAS
ncbi:A-kinase anchor protein 12b isoform X2 [Stigmatopora argus]